MAQLTWKLAFFVTLNSLLVEEIKDSAYQFKSIFAPIYDNLSRKCRS